jgi:hypothetical protein
MDISKVLWFHDVRINLSFPRIDKLLRGNLSSKAEMAACRIFTSSCAEAWRNHQIEQAGLPSHARCNFPADPFEHDGLGQSSKNIALFYPSDLPEAIVPENQNFSFDVK